MDYINSDISPTMAAVKTFYRIVQQVQTSNLNYQLHLTPFAANISLKKTPVKDRSGGPLPPPTQVFQSVDPVLVDELGNKMAEVKHEFASNVAEHGDVYQELLEYRAAVDKLNPNRHGGGGRVKIPSRLLSA